MSDYTQGISIDGITYQVPLVSIKRTADFYDAYAKRTIDGDLKRKLIGVYFNYQMSFGTIEDDDTYEALFNKLSEPVEFHDFSLPTTKGTYSFKGYVSSLSDQVEKVYSNTTTFKGLTCKFTAKTPAMTPS